MYYLYNYLIKPMGPLGRLAGDVKINPTQEDFLECWKVWKEGVRTVFNNLRKTLSKHSNMVEEI